MPGPTDGHAMTSIEDGGAGAAPEARNGTTTAPDPQGDNFVDEQAGDGNFDGGAEAGANGEAPLDGEGEADPQAGDPEGGDAPDAGDSKFDPDAFREDILRTVKESMAPPPEPPRELTDEEWARKEEEYGVSRTAIKAFTNQSMRVYNAMRDYVDAQFASIHKDNTLRSIAQEKGYTDAMRYRKDVDQFLSKYDPKHHSNPELLKMAVVYSRGLAATKDIRRAQNSGERNRRIGGPARPSSPGSSTSGRRPGAPTVLSREQREVARKFNMSDGEYAGMLKKRGTPIAI